MYIYNMTFIPSVLSKIDNNNSFTANSSITTNGVYSNTNGYNNIQLSIIPSNSNNSANGTIGIIFSSDGLTSTYTINDNFTNGNFEKKYKILDNYYKISINPNNDVIVKSRLLTDTYLSTTNSINSSSNNEDYKVDAFGKLRVSEPNTILDIHLPYLPSGSTGTTGYLSNSTQLSIGVTGGATYTTTTDSHLILNTSGATSYGISQSRNYCSYLPGKSMLIKASCIMDTGANSNNVVSRVGYFDDYNGLYFEYTADGSGSGTISVVLKNNGVIKTQKYQTNWNIDKMDGTGISGLKLNFTKAQLFVIDFEWLGIGKIRFGFYAYGKIIYCHEITNINDLDAPYMSSSNLPIRYMIQSNTIGQTGSMKQICSTVISEGGYNPIGKPFSITNAGITGISGDTSEKNILMLRGGNSTGNYYHQNIIPYSINLVDTGNNNLINYKVRMYRDGNVPQTPISWSDVDTNNSIAQYAIGSTGTTTSNSIIVSQGFFSGRGSISLGDLSNVFDNKTLQITSNVNNVSDILSITATGIGTITNATIYADINWNEY